jgi:hypothetical protein
MSAVHDKPLPLYFPKEASALKRRICIKTDNPFSKEYVVDAVVSYGGDDTPKMFTIIKLHDIAARLIGDPSLPGVRPIPASWHVRRPGSSGQARG